MGFLPWFFCTMPFRDLHQRVTSHIKRCFERLPRLPGLDVTTALSKHPERVEVVPTYSSRCDCFQRLLLRLIEQTVQQRSPAFGA